MRLHEVPYAEIEILKNRQRTEMDSEELMKLAGSIAEHGLLHPIVIRRDQERFILVAGERRFRALNIVWNLQDYILCGTHKFPEGVTPCLMLGDMDPLMAEEAELEENIRRVDLSWQDRAKAEKRLFDLRAKQAEINGTESPTVKSITDEIGGRHSVVKENIIVARHLDDPDIAKAKSANEAFKVLKRKETAAKNEALAASIGETFTNSVHKLHQGNCLEILKDYPNEYFDVILTDPPYGIGADTFGNSGGIASGSHFYDDSLEAFQTLLSAFAVESFRVAKLHSHLYLFCDIDNFVFLKTLFKSSGWNVFRTPIIWVNPTAARAPWPEHGPQRKYQICLYARKGDKIVTRLYGDVITHATDENLGHQAQKPVGLYLDLLRRSVTPGDVVLDAFGGSGPILPAAHELKCKAVYIEMDAAAFGIAVKRAEDLK